MLDLLLTENLESLLRRTSPVVLKTFHVGESGEGRIVMGLPIAQLLAQRAPRLRALQLPLCTHIPNRGFTTLARALHDLQVHTLFF